MKNLLLLDDDIELRKVYEAILKRQGFNVTALPPKNDIQVLIAKHQPDLLVLNYLMYGVNGGELCSIVKNDPLTQHIPVIILTDYDRVMPDAGLYGCDLFLPKSIGFDLFITHVNNLLNKNSSSVE